MMLLGGDLHDAHICQGLDEVKNRRRLLSRLFRDIKHRHPILFPPRNKLQRGVDNLRQPRRL
jgi:hypothetical protein